MVGCGSELTGSAGAEAELEQERCGAEYTGNSLALVDALVEEVPHWRLHATVEVAEGSKGSRRARGRATRAAVELDGHVSP